MVHQNTGDVVAGGLNRDCSNIMGHHWHAVDYAGVLILADRVRPGIAVGAVVGALAGAVSGGAEIFESKDQAFKSYVQEAAEGQLSAQKEAVTSADMAHCTQ